MNDYYEDILITDKTVENYIRAIAFLSWENRVGRFSQNQKKEIGALITTLSTTLHKIRTDENFSKKLNTSFFMSHEQQSIIRQHKKYLTTHKQIPSTIYEEYIQNLNDSYEAWKDAKEKSDFSIYSPFLKRSIDYLKLIAENVGYLYHPYDVSLANFNDDLNTKKLDKMFQNIEIFSLDLIKKNQNLVTEDYSHLEIKEDKQEEIVKGILEQIGFDFKRGQLDKALHPFMMKISSEDVRIATKFNLTNIYQSISFAIHEFGHAVYEQNISYKEGILSRGISHSFHEGQAKLFENFIGRSKEFWKYFLPFLKKELPSIFKEVDLNFVLNHLNNINLNLQRVKADEVTYNLHIIMRYKIEKLLIGGELNIIDLEEYWIEKSKEYFGRPPQNASEGILQDMHWSIGNFGHFPTYILGMVYAAQIYNQIELENPNFKTNIANGDFGGVLSWLTKNIYTHGRLYSVSDLMLRVCGEEINEKYLLTYLDNKYNKNT